MDAFLWPDFLIIKHDTEKIYQVRTISWHNLWRGAGPHMSNRMKRSNLQKRHKTYSVLGCVGEWEKEFLFFMAKLHAKAQKPWKSLFVLQFRSRDGSFRHDEMKITLCISSMSRGTLELILMKKADKKCKDQKRSIFLTKGVVIGKSIFQIQRINTVHSKCSSSGVLRDIPLDFTRSVRRRIVL